MELYEFCKDNLIDEKIFIVPTKTVGMQMVNKMAREGSPSINLKIVTLKGLAFEICDEYIEKNIKLVVDSITGSNLIMDILKSLSKKEPEFFFKTDLIESRTAQEVYKAIMELKYAGIEEFPTTKNLDKIYKEYQDTLGELNAIDHPDVIIIASTLDELNNYKMKKISVASNIEFNYVEKILFEKLTGGDFVKIQMPVKTLEGHPRNYYFKDFEKDDILRNKSINFFKKYGTKEEINFIIDDIKTRKLPLDEIVIAYTNNKYADLINIEFEQKGFPITFGDGLGIEGSSIYRFINTIFNWTNKYYSLTELRPIFANGDIKTPMSAPSLYDELLTYKIIFGRNNYFKKLYLNEYIPLDLDLSVYRKDKLIWLKEFFEDLFDTIPNENNFEFSKYIPKLINLIEKYVKNINKYDGAAKRVVLETLGQIEDITMEINREDYFDMVLSYIRRNRILRSQPQPGSVFTTNFRNAGYTGRKYLYLIGMDSDSISNKIIESPILLDILRARLSNNLKYANENYNSKKYKIKELLTGDFENISIGYSNFDTVEIKAKSPSQVYTELMETCKVCYDAGPEKEEFTILGRNLVRSGSALETLSGCSRKTYLSYKMGLWPIDEKEIRVEYWLDALERGILVHNVLNRYFDLDKNERKDDRLNEILEEECTQERENKASILDEVYLREKANILKICKEMIKNSYIDDDWDVLVNELSFGMDKDNQIFGILPIIKINILDLELDVIGAIDRVDVNNKTKEIRIIDYKTGSKTNFDKLLRITNKIEITNDKGKKVKVDEHDYSQTRKMQYYIYRNVLDEIIKNHPLYKDYKISTFSYIFEKGLIDIKFDDDFIEVIEDRISDLLNINVLEEQKKVVFNSEDKDSCLYCDYSPICIVDRDLNLDDEGVDD